MWVLGDQGGSKVVLMAAIILPTFRCQNVILHIRCIREIKEDKKWTKPTWNIVKIVPFKSRNKLKEW